MSKSDDILTRINPALNNAPSAPPTIIVNSKSYIVPELPTELQTVIALYRRFEGELDVAKIEVYKLEAALRGLTRELEARFSQLEATKIEGEYAGIRAEHEGGSAP